MRSTKPCTIVETYASLDTLPADAEPLFAAAATFFATRAWWEAVLAHATPPDARPLLLLIRINGEAAALFPMLLDKDGFRALTTPYTCLYEPLIAPACTGHGAIFAALGGFCRSFHPTRLDALDEPIVAALVLGGRQSGLAVARFDHFGNWYENVAGLDWSAYLASRPGALRETIRRRTRRAGNLAGAEFQLFVQSNDVESGIAAFETVYARSWKQSEPCPAFNPAQIRAAGRMGRLGVWSIGGRPIAAQFWIVEQRRATVLKLAHDAAFDAHSPGTVLTAWMIRHLIEQERVTELDFGRGDDPYKQGWVANRRQRAGVLLINPRRPAGMAMLARHAAGRLAARLRPIG
jgi:CelD/BcsL family acetyltransferase involved in cellulose biosynthesis